MAEHVIQILTCPFCGSDPTVIYRKIFKEYFVQCDNPKCQCIQGRNWGTPTILFCNKLDAINNWNDRRINRWASEVKERSI
jgi:hypothetical protein